MNELDLELNELDLLFCRVWHKIRNQTSKNPCWLTIDKIRIIHESGFYLFLASSPLSSAYLTERDDSLSDRLKLSVSALSIVIPIQGWIVRELFCFKKSCRWCKQNIICKYDEYPAKICHHPCSCVNGTNKSIKN